MSDNSSSIHDSQDSDESVTTIYNSNNHKIKDEKSTSKYPEVSDEEIDSDIDLYLIDDSEDDEILLKMSSFNGSSKKPAVIKNENGYINIKSFDLGDLYNEKVTKNLNSIESAEDKINNEKKKFVSKTFTKSNELMAKLSKNFTNSQLSYYIDTIIKDANPDKYLDWHFIEEDTTIDDISPILSFETAYYNCHDFNRIRHEILKSYPNLNYILPTFGISKEKLNSINDGYFCISDYYNYDNLCTILPTDSMKSIIIYYIDEPNFVKFFLCFILDKKIYESNDCDSKWCEEIVSALDVDVIEEYLKLINLDDYYMHYRLTKLLPSFKNKLVDGIFGDNTLALNRIIDEFNTIFDDKEYRKLLYFSIFIFGSDLVPYSKESLPVIDYIFNCIRDVSDMTNVADIELLLLKSILTSFTKIIGT
ncbi:hypothetical protein Kpol_423p2 [Vanderwaltozyma polyspora DSM 70294]|uniref:Uncharacterized protein n=1 Tax=Vanderwaltozyma polyspora (strain ATCC 22028 / DSM 70294 / BCRC 21397 / CBS 2163 / NBRC 10782 / NRRL Y-8283 / UCD 57-17) TaxID=436907 RepID=A7TR81_VANPO|nr:uncharacterized protein Kpol_423p2 [Vanderwaltozyma polyspora DSM 70294]EDO15214.1 hypothetical protein Kpol_423p2 [Vanderwaltozyma polyspora DSM 70294]